MKFFVKRAALILLLVAGAAALSAQTGTKSAASPVAKSASTSKSNSNNTTKSLPGKIPPVQGIIKTVFTVSLRYEEIKLGTGAPAEPHQRYLILYTGYRAADRVKIRLLGGGAAVLPLPQPRSRMLPLRACCSRCA